MNRFMKIALSVSRWLRNPCRLGHKYWPRNGAMTRIRSAERGLPGEMIIKHPDGGWVRHQRFCKRCSAVQYLSASSPTEGSWKDIL